MREFAFPRPFVIAYWCVAVLVAFLECNNTNDFRIFSAAATDLFAGKDVYTTTYFDGYHFFYGLCFALFIYPLTLMPYAVALFIWLLLNFWFLYRVLVLLNMYVQRHKAPVRLWHYVIVLVFLVISMRFIRDNIHLGQMTIYILWSCIESFHALQQKKHIKAGILLALAIHIKLLPLVVLPWLLYRSYYRALAYSVLFLFLFYALPILFIGAKQNGTLLHSWVNLVNPTNTQHVLDIEERSFHGLTTWAPVFFMKDVYEPYALPIPRNFMSLSFQQMQWVLNGLRLLLIALCLWVFKAPPFRQQTNTFYAVNELFFIMALIPLIFPHQQGYAFLLQCPLLCTSIILCYRLQNKPFLRKTYFIILAIVALVYNLSIILGHFTPYYNHFKTVTWAGLLLVPIALHLNTLSYSQDSENQNNN